MKEKKLKVIAVMDDDGHLVTYSYHDREYLYTLIQEDERLSDIATENDMKLEEVNFEDINEKEFWSLMSCFKQRGSFEFSEVSYPASKKKEKLVEIVEARHFDIFVAHNDAHDISCGGSPTLGYGFFVSLDEPYGEMLEFLRASLKKHGRTYQNITYNKIKNVRSDQLWTREAIYKCIKDNYVGG